MIVWKNTNEAVVKMVPKSHWYLNLELFFFSQQKVETPFPPHCYYTMCLEKEEAICLVSECATDVFFVFFYVVFTKAESLLTLLSSLSGSLFTTSLIQSKNGVKEILLNTRPVAFLMCLKRMKLVFIRFYLVMQLV